MQAIHSADRTVHGYELLYRAGTANEARLSGDAEHDRATAQVVGATFGEFGLQVLSGGRPVFLNAPRSVFTGRLPLPIPAEGVVLELLETVEVDREVSAGLLRLEERGFRIAVDDFAGERSRLAVVERAAYVKIDLQAVGDRLAGLVGMVRDVNPAAAVVVERVETQEQFDVCRDLGADLFQGYLLHRPDVLQRQALTSSHLVCARMLSVLSDGEAPTDAVLELLASDPGLSLRVLKTVSSAAHAPRNGFTSLRQAVVMLGRHELRDWMVLVLVAGSGASPVSETMLEWVFTRAEACRGLSPFAAEAAFTVGLLSSIAEVLGLDAVELIHGCALHPSVADALVAAGGPLSPVLSAVRDHERNLSAGAPDPGPDGASGCSRDDVGVAYLRAQILARSRVASLTCSRP
ncbi:EAL and HDOD domain-containing protein [Kineococcus sp. DHX-1]|uniref:EAL and HDOD domain-containing protein n=1 Tax=Kineococcus sp. DHX-1 TaxID=3349638 RepID=UPI0036D412EF